MPQVDVSEIIKELEAERQQASEKEESIRSQILEMFLKNNVTKLYVSFSGSGDEGCVDDISYTFFGGSTAQGPSYIGKVEELEPKIKPFHELVVKWIDIYLESTNVDWFNNDGGQGEITIDLTTVPYQIDAYVDYNITSSERGFTEEGIFG